MRHDASPGVECVRQRIVEKIPYIRRINISKSEQTPGEICRVVVRAEHAAELLVEY